MRGRRTLDLIDLTLISSCSRAKGWFSPTCLPAACCVLLWVRAMETAVEAGFARQLGVSNIKSMSQLERLWEEASVKPAVVQMRFHAKTNFEREMRAWCSEKGTCRTLTNDTPCARIMCTHTSSSHACYVNVRAHREENELVLEIIIVFVESLAVV
jgi:aryl-alcohol dehydrogenase-like predicted oxidoreductase